MDNATLDIVLRLVDEVSANVAKIAATVKTQTAGMSGSTDAVTASMKRLNESLSGSRLFQDAKNIAAAVEGIGGAGKLTESEMARVNATVTQALAKYKALGQEAPAALEQLAAATSKNENAISSMFTKYTTGVAAGVASGELLVGGIEKIGEVALATGEKVVEFFKESVEAAAKLESAEARLSAAVTASGHAADGSLDSFRKLAGTIADTTTTSKTAALDMQARFIQLGGVSAAGMGQATQAALDLSAGLKIDLESAVTMISKALEGHVTGLQRYGVILDADRVKAEGASYIFEQLNSRFGGQAQMQLETYAGQVQKLGNTWEEFQANVGKVITQDPVVQAALHLMNESLENVSDATQKSDRTLIDYSADVMDKLIPMGGMWQMYAAKVKQASEEELRAYQIHGMVEGAMKRMEPIWSKTAQLPPITAGFSDALAASNKMFENTVMLQLGLTEVQKLQINGAIAVGLSAKEAAELSDANIVVVERYVESVKKAQEEQKKFAAITEEMNAAGEGWRGTLDKIDGTVVESIKYYLAAGVEQGKLATFFGLTAVQVKAVDSAMKEEIETTKTLADIHKLTFDLAQQHEKERRAEAEKTAAALNASVASTLATYKQFAEKNAELGLHGTELQVAQIDTVYRAEVAKLGERTVQNARYYDAAKALIDSYYAYQLNAIYVNSKALQDNNATTLREIADNAWTTYMAMKAAPNEYAATTIEKFHQIAKAAEDAANGVSHPFQAAFGDIMSAIPGLIQQGFTGGGGLAGAGHAIGSMVGTTIGKSIVADMTENSPEFMGTALGKMFGAAIPVLGSLAGPLISAIIKLFDHTADDVARDAGEKFGTKFGKATSDAILADIKAGMTEAGAELNHLDAIIKDAGGITAKNVDLMTSKFHDLFSMLQTGQMAEAQVNAQLTAGFPQLAAAATDATGRWSEGLKSVIMLSRQAGLENQAITDALKTQGTNALAGFNAVVAGTSDALAGYDAVAKGVADATTAVHGLAKASIDTQSLIDAMGVDERKAFAADFIKAQTEGFKGDIAAFFQQQATLYSYATEGDPRLKTMMWGDTLKKFTDQQKAASDAVTSVIAGMKGDEARSLNDAFVQALQDGFKGTITDFLLQQNQLYGVAQEGDKRLKTWLSGQTIAELNALPAVQQYNKALTDQQNAAAAAKQELGDLGIQAVATYAAAVASGTSEADALKAIHPALASLEKSYDDLGLSVDNVALSSLMMRDKILTAAPQLMGAVDGLSQELVALDNLGLMNASTFAAMQRTGMETYTRLQAQVAALGGTTKDALGPMQGYLHQAVIEAQKLGIPLDANTQMLIDQSKDAGIWQDALTPKDKLLAGMQTLVDKVGELIDRLNGIPKKIDIDATTHYGTDGTPPIVPDDTWRTMDNAAATGALVTTTGLMHTAYLAKGGPVGTDTVNAWLSPGEVVLSIAQRDAAATWIAAAQSFMVSVEKMPKVIDDLWAAKTPSATTWPTVPPGGIGYGGGGSFNERGPYASVPIPSNAPPTIENHYHFSPTVQTIDAKSTAAWMDQDGFRAFLDHVKKNSRQSGMDLVDALPIDWEKL